MRGPGWLATPLDLADNPSSEDIDRLYKGSQSQVYDEIYQQWMAGLPAQGEVMYGLGPHSIPILEDVLGRIRPRRILEIGFGVGYSATMFLEIRPGTVVYSIDLTEDPRALEAVELLRKRYAGWFHFIRADSRMMDAGMVLSGLPAPAGFDLLFVDGGHDEPTVRSDIRLGLHLGIPWILFDDWWPHFGPGVQPAVHSCPILTIAGRWGNMVLARVKRFPCGAS